MDRHGFFVVGRQERDGQQATLIDNGRRDEQPSPAQFGNAAAAARRGIHIVARVVVIGEIDSCTVPLDLRRPPAAPAGFLGHRSPRTWSLCGSCGFLPPPPARQGKATGVSRIMLVCVCVASKQSCYNYSSAASEQEEPATAAPQPGVVTSYWLASVPRLCFDTALCRKINQPHKLLPARLSCPLLAHSFPTTTTRKKVVLARVGRSSLELPPYVVRSSALAVAIDPQCGSLLLASRARAGRSPIHKTQHYHSVQPTSQLFCFPNKRISHEEWKISRASTVILHLKRYSSDTTSYPQVCLCRLLSTYVVLYVVHCALRAAALTQKGS